MKEDEKAIRRFMKLCIRHGNKPICLVTVDKQGHPHVYTDYQDGVLKQVFQRLASSPVVESTQHPQ